MNYELAKKLKDAGFPQEKCLYYFGGIGIDVKDSLQVGHVLQAEVMVEPYKQEWVASPTLSELIEACGEGYIILERDGGFWTAGIQKYSGTNEIFQRKLQQYSTPDEAVANLYLKLNEHS